MLKDSVKIYTQKCIYVFKWSHRSSCWNIQECIQINVLELKDFYWDLWFDIIQILEKCITRMNLIKSKYI